MPLSTALEAQRQERQRTRAERVYDALLPLRYLSSDTLAVDAAHAPVFDLEELLDAVFLAPMNHQNGADAAFLHAERSYLGRDDALVDADDAVCERLGDAPDAADVAAVEIGGEPPVQTDRGVTL